MSERDDLIEIHSITVMRITDDAVTHINAGNIEEALLLLERAVLSCEEHPAFAQLETSSCQSVRRILEACDAVSLRVGGPWAQSVPELLRRMHALKDSLH